MGIIEIILLGFGLAMDSFAVAICLGLNMKRATAKNALIVGAYFGAFQAIMPAIGYFAAKFFAQYITAFDHWIAFGLLSVLGLKMIFEAVKKDKPADLGETSLRPKKMLPLSFATSIDALAVGISFAMIKPGMGVLWAVVAIGIITFAVCSFGVKIGNLFGKRAKSRAEIIGGVILILIGLKILLGHYGVIGW